MVSLVKYLPAICQIGFLPKEVNLVSLLNHPIPLHWVDDQVGHVEVRENVYLARNGSLYCKQFDVCCQNITLYEVLDPIVHAI